MNNNKKLLMLLLCFALTGCKVILTPSSTTDDSSSLNEEPSFDSSSSDNNLSSTDSSSTKDSSSSSDSSSSQDSSSSSSDSSSSQDSSSSSSDSSSSQDSSSSSSDSSSSQDSSSSSSSSSSQQSSSPSIDQEEPPSSDDAVNVTLVGNSFESAYFQWTPYANATSYKVYCDGVAIDQELIRKYSSYYRADVVGLTATKHKIDIVPVYNNQELTTAMASYKVTPLSHIREGFAFVDGTSSGAYNDDGSLKSNANVIYIDNNNKDTVSLKVKASSSSSSEFKGLQNILDAYKKGYESKPLNVRFIGNITDFSYMMGGDIEINLNNKTTTQGITFEGIGNDATLNGFGIRIKNSTNIEIRNLGFMNCDSDEGDNISLQQANKYVWVHNNDLFYGHAGSDADQAKGDGALDTKTSSHVTHSFNHFWDTGKSNLQGMKSESTDNLITYHHNWYDHSDSRHPRIRTCTVHVYNNYFDGVAKYGVGATMGSSVFVENNYFRNTYRPMSISMQGLDSGTFSSEDGGIIKAYGNEIIGGVDLITYSENNASFDYYDAKSRNEVVPDTVVTLQGGTTYNNFDTKGTMYSYNVQTATEAKETVTEYAGRVQGGDFKWTFTSADDTDYNVNTNLKAALVAYQGYVPGTIVEDNNNSGSDDTNNDGNDSSNNNTSTTNATLTFDSLTSGDLTSNITISDTFEILATSSKKVSITSESVTVDNITYNTVLKLEGKGNTEYRSIKINLTEAATIKVIAKNNSTSERLLGLLDNEGETLQSFASPTSNAAILTYTVTSAGTYYIASLNSGINIYGIIIEYN